jgi:hypothetical protein
MSTVAIMQPYLFPYLGYFQLIHAVDKFVVLDDVTYIKKGWINRNRVLINGKPHYFTVPLAGASQNRRICDIALADQAWKPKMLKMFDHAYRRAPHYMQIFPLVERVLAGGAGAIGDLAFASLQIVCEFLGVATAFVPSTRSYGNHQLKGQARILDICAREQATTYINAAGGRNLYASEDFSAQGIELKFIRTLECEYDQGCHPFQPHLSILDVLMFTGRDRTVEFLDRYELLPGPPRSAGIEAAPT